MSQTLRLAVAQSRTLSSTAATLAALEATARRARDAHSADLVLFPEAYLGGYPRTCSFGAAVGSRADGGRDQFLHYFHAAVDLGDTPQGAGDAWTDRALPLARGAARRGDGTREALERIAAATGVFLVTGVVERAGGSLYCAVLYVCPARGVLGKRRKVMPTGTERLVWAQGAAATLRAVVTTIRGVRLTLAAAICWENLMPLLRQALYAQNVNLYLAPTADPRDTWAPLMQTVAQEGRCFVLSANQCVTRANLPAWIRDPRAAAEPPPPAALADPPPLSPLPPPKLRRQEVPRENGTPSRAPRRGSSVSRTADGHEVCWPSSPRAPLCTPSAPLGGLDAEEYEPVDGEAVGTANGVAAVPAAKEAVAAAPADADFVSRGGSLIVGPSGHVLEGPLWEVEEGGLLVAECDFADCTRGRLDLDVAGSYSRSDAFELRVAGLDLSPPP